MELSHLHVICGQNLKGVVRYVGNVYAHDSNFCICCGVDGCHRTYRKFVYYKKHIYEKHIKISHASGAGLLQPEDMEVLIDDRQDGFDEDDSISLSPTDVVGNNQMKISALFLMKLENEFKVVSAALDCIIEDVTTLLDNKNDSLHNELFAKLS